MKLNVEVMSASNLKAKDGNGSSNPYVKLKFAGKYFFTNTINRTLNPTWNESFIFDISNPRELSSLSLKVVVYHRKQSSGYGKKSLGEVTIRGSSFVPESDATAATYHLRRSCLPRGEIRLKVYTTNNTGDDPDNSGGDDGGCIDFRGVDFNSCCACSGSACGGGCGGSTCAVAIVPKFT